LEDIMVSDSRPKKIFATLAVASALALYTPAPFAKHLPAVAGQSPESSAAKASSASGPTLDYEFFKARVEPIFLKKRSADHARCYVCHQMMRHGGGPLSLKMLPPGASFWTEEQSRSNFEVVSNLVVPGEPLSSLFLLMPLAPEAGGLADTHQGGRQFANQDDPDWKNMAAWVRGEKLQSSSKAQ
jgi:hypothetical protein